MIARKDANRIPDAKPDRFTPLFNDAFLQIFGSADSAPVTQPLVNAIQRAAGLPEMQNIERITAELLAQSSRSS